MIRHGITASPTSPARYQLFRTDVTSQNTFSAGYDLHPDSFYGKKVQKSQSLIPTPQEVILL